MRWRCPGKDMLGWGHGRENCAAAVKVCVVVWWGGVGGDAGHQTMSGDLECGRQSRW